MPSRSVSIIRSTVFPAVRFAGLTSLSSIRASLGPAAGEELAAWLVARALRTDRPTSVATLRALEGCERASALAAARVPVRALNAAPGSTGRLATAVEANRRHADFDAVLL